MKANKWPKRCVCYGGMKKNKHIFISRDLSLQSVFRKQLLDNKCTVEGQSLVVFSRQPFSDFPETDWIFFYSVKAAAYFREGLIQLGLTWPAKPKIAAIGEGTAQWLHDRGVSLEFIGSGKPLDTCKQFLRFSTGASVLFPQASQSRKSIEKLAGNQIESIPLIVYHNRMKADFVIQPADVLTFTSPLNAQAYFKRYPDSSQKPIVAIGQTTQRALAAMGRSVTEVANAPNESSLAAAVLRCLEDISS